MLRSSQAYGFIACYRELISLGAMEERGYKGDLGLDGVLKSGSATRVLTWIT